MISNIDYKHKIDHPALDSRKDFSYEKACFGKFKVDFANVQATFAIFVFCSFATIVSLVSSPPKLLFEKAAFEMPAHIQVESSEELMEKLKELNLWEIDDDSLVPPVLFTGFPDNIHELDIDLKKKAFFHTLLPVALVALSEVEKEKKRFNQILNKYNPDNLELVFNDDYASWGRGLTIDEINFIIELTRKYRTNIAAELINRIDLVPLSLIMAQAALESSWGASRFAQLGNNLFGIWTWGAHGIIPSGRDDGKRHKVAAYDSILDSVRAYIVMLNRLPAYRNFRRIRQLTMDSKELAEGLLYYSEKREEYVWEIRNVITQNKLREYDNMILNTMPVKEGLWLKFTSLFRGDHAFL
ncbi:MAG: glucosaminidase domain-containing protein [Proteobacteria bacterium]|nr:glucosaminidase domain-containing protein [Pseudomonadota bacterium]MBU1714753.1 glucosaminidase domain-containing protein [Pseudomonadota bacterium]